MKLLMVCLGNICRSPMAQGILESKIKKISLNWEVDSAGTSGCHDGEKPDQRAIETCKRYGIDITKQRSRKLKQEDFSRFDWILTMDKSNLENVLKLSPDIKYSKKVKPLLSFLSYHSSYTEVPDPYYYNNFDEVFSLLESVMDLVIEDLTNESVSRI